MSSSLLVTIENGRVVPLNPRSLFALIEMFVSGHEQWQEDYERMRDSTIVSLELLERLSTSGAAMLRNEVIASLSAMVLRLIADASRRVNTEKKEFLTEEETQKLSSICFDAAITGISDTCAVCLVEFESGEKLTQLPCGKHAVFHTQCILQWLKRSIQCPCCRADVRAGLGLSARGTSASPQRSRSSSTESRNQDAAARLPPVAILSTLSASSTYNNSSSNSSNISANYFQDAASSRTVNSGTRSSPRAAIETPNVNRVSPAPVSGASGFITNLNIPNTPSPPSFDPHTRSPLARSRQSFFENSNTNAAATTDDPVAASSVTSTPSRSRLRVAREVSDSRSSAATTTTQAPAARQPISVRDWDWDDEQNSENLQEIERREEQLHARRALRYGASRLVATSSSPSTSSTASPTTQATSSPSASVAHPPRPRASTPTLPANSGDIRTRLNMTRRMRPVVSLLDPTATSASVPPSSPAASMIRQSASVHRSHEISVGMGSNAVRTRRIRVAVNA